MENGGKRVHGGVDSSVQRDPPKFYSLSYTWMTVTHEVSLKFMYFFVPIYPLPIAKHIWHQDF